MTDLLLNEGYIMKWFKRLPLWEQIYIAISVVIVLVALSMTNCHAAEIKLERVHPSAHDFYAYLYTWPDGSRCLVVVASSGFSPSISASCAWSSNDRPADAAPRR
jgi:hypothetical protein